MSFGTLHIVPRSNLKHVLPRNTTTYSIRVPPSHKNEYVLPLNATRIPAIPVCKKLASYYATKSDERSVMADSILHNIIFLCDLH
jgi:hypothetical protein